MRTIMWEKIRHGALMVIAAAAMVGASPTTDARFAGVTGEARLFEEGAAPRDYTRQDDAFRGVTGYAVLLPSTARDARFTGISGSAHVFAQNERPRSDYAREMVRAEVIE